MLLVQPYFLLQLRGARDELICGLWALGLLPRSVWNWPGFFGFFFAFAPSFFSNSSFFPLIFSFVSGRTSVCVNLLQIDSVYSCLKVSVKFSESCHVRLNLMTAMALNYSNIVLQSRSLSSPTHSTQETSRVPISKGGNECTGARSLSERWNLNNW